MSTLYKHHGNIIGVHVQNDAKYASGVWNMRQVHAESMNMTWSEQVMYDSSRDGFGGWTLTGGATIDTTNGSPTGDCISLTDVGDRAVIQPLTNYANNDFLNCTIILDVYLTGGAIGIHYASTSAGQGPYLKFDVRGGTYYTGIMYSTGWTTYPVLTSQPIAGTQNQANGWRQVKIQLSNAANTYWYTEKVLRDTQVVLYNGNYLAISKYAENSVAYIDNIQIYRGFI